MDVEVEGGQCRNCALRRSIARGSAWRGAGGSHSVNSNTDDEVRCEFDLVVVAVVECALATTLAAVTVGEDG